MPECEGWVSKHWWRAQREGPEKCQFFMKAPAGREAWLRGAFWKGTAPGEGCGGAPATLVPSRDARARGQPGTAASARTSSEPGGIRRGGRSGPFPETRLRRRAARAQRRGQRGGQRQRGTRDRGGASGGGGSRGGRAERGACARPGPGSLLSGRGRRWRQREVVSAAAGGPRLRWSGGRRWVERGEPGCIAARHGAARRRTVRRSDERPRGGGRARPLCLRFGGAAGRGGAGGGPCPCPEAGGGAGLSGPVTCRICSGLGDLEVSRWIMAGASLLVWQEGQEARRGAPPPGSGGTRARRSRQPGCLFGLRGRKGLRSRRWECSPRREWATSGVNFCDLALKNAS